MGTGVKISTVERYYDGLLQKQLVNAQTTQGYDTTKSSVLQQVEPSFNEVSTDGLGAAITNFFGAWQDLTLNPAGSAEASGGVEPHTDIDGQFQCRQYDP